jgi:hypothetical protein
MTQQPEKGPVMGKPQYLGNTSGCRFRPKVDQAGRDGVPARGSIARGRDTALRSGLCGTDYAETDCTGADCA